MVYHVQFPGLGLDLTVNRVALAIGGFNIYWYGVIIAAGMLLAMLYAFRNAVDYGIDSDRLVDVVAIGTVMAIVCARIYYVALRYTHLSIFSSSCFSFSAFSLDRSLSFP